MVTEREPYYNYMYSYQYNYLTQLRQADTFPQKQEHTVPSLFGGKKQKTKQFVTLRSYKTFQNTDVSIISCFCCRSAIKWTFFETALCTEYDIAHSIDLAILDFYTNGKGISLNNGAMINSCFCCRNAIKWTFSVTALCTESDIAYSTDLTILDFYINGKGISLINGAMINSCF